MNSENQKVILSTDSSFIDSLLKFIAATRDIHMYYT